MKTLALKGQLRSNIGKKAAADFRRAEMIPCVLYGGSENVHFAASEADLKSFIYTPNVYFADIEIEGKNYRGVMKDLQFDPVTDKPLHVDFLAVSDDKDIKVELPIVVTGNSVGVRAGGKLVVNVRKLLVKGLPANMPDSIELDISNLNIGDSLRIRDLKSNGFEFLSSPSIVVAAVRMTRSAKAAQASSEK